MLHLELRTFPVHLFLRVPTVRVARLVQASGAEKGLKCALDICAGATGAFVLLQLGWHGRIAGQFALLHRAIFDV